MHLITVNAIRKRYHLDLEFLRPYCGFSKKDNFIPKSNPKKNKTTIQAEAIA